MKEETRPAQFGYLAMTVVLLTKRSEYRVSRIKLVCTQLVEPSGFLYHDLARGNSLKRSRNGRCYGVQSQQRFLTPKEPLLLPNVISTRAFFYVKKLVVV